jgi:hypothetical protein
MLTEPALTSPGPDTPAPPADRAVRAGGWRQRARQAGITLMALAAAALAIVAVTVLGGAGAGAAGGCGGG